MGRRPVYVDAEDPHRSSWCRFINHAHYDSPACNLEPRTDPRRVLVWFEARRAIEAGEELGFSYGKAFNDSYGKQSHSGAVSDWHAKCGASPSAAA